mmetsp:Transcript_23363/g.33516  ORF Transcript_23363/g.33516 Transcript_23363/m.33516 type:complete len:1554 (+) Transcript_23363:3270-7931(+)
MTKPNIQPTTNPLYDPPSAIQPEPPHPEARSYLLTDPASPKYTTKSTIRIMRKAALAELPAIVEYRLHLDGGANMSVTPEADILINYRSIKRRAIAGVAEGAPALYATGIGYLPWRAHSGETLLVKCYYSAQAADTIISPTDVVINRVADFNAWSQYANVDDGSGYIAFHRRDSTQVTRFPLTSHNGLWFYETSGFNDYHTIRSMDGNNEIIRRMSKAAEHELWHARLAHPGETTSKDIHKHVKGCPVLRGNAFYKCGCCMQEKMKHRSFPEITHSPVRNVARPSTPPALDPNPDLCPIREQFEKDLLPGQMFQIDTGFVRGTGFSAEDPDGRRVTSMDGYNSYLLIVDRATRRHWLFLRKVKTPPIDIVKTFLEQNGNRKSTRRIVRTDQGGELWGSGEFHQMIKESNFLLEPTATGTPEQNGLVERPNQTLGIMVRCLLSTANLQPEYWSWAILHAVYIKNRLPHRAIGCTPFEAWTGRQPNVKHLRIFGCPVVVRLKGERAAKLDNHTTNGFFLGYTATDKNIYYQDSSSKRIKIATHVTFDEAGMTLPPAQRTPAMNALIALGMTETHSGPADPDAPPSYENIHDVEQRLQVKLLSPNATLPLRATTESAGYDLFSAVDITIQPGNRQLVATDLSIKPPVGTYGQIMPRSGLALQHFIDVKAGVIDRDYRGNVQVLLANNGAQPFSIQSGNRIAQLVLYDITTPAPIATDHLDDTDRGDEGFGSTGVSGSTIRQASTEPAAEITTNILDPPDRAPVIANVHDITEQVLAEDGIKPYNLWLSNDPFDKRITVSLDVKGLHPTLGMIFTMCPIRNRPQLSEMEKSTPGARLSKWRSTVKAAYLLTINDVPVATLAQVATAISNARKNKVFKVHMQFATERSFGVHPVDGNLMLYYDQMNAFAQHIQEADLEHRSESQVAGDHAEAADRTPPDPDHSDQTAATIRELQFVPPGLHISTETTEIKEVQSNPELGKFFSKKAVRQRADWQEWRESQWKQLNQYHTQGMFSDPMVLPAGASACYMLWTYQWKMDETKKARMVLDGARNRTATTQGHTYANSLDAPSERLFWAVVAKRGLIAIGADVSNAFAEAPPPVAPLYMFIDDAFRDWWVHHLKREPIPPECNVVRVCRAIQGHPESPRLWEKHIDNILKEMGFTPTRHEPCLYRATVNGELVFFLRQVDDFSVAAKEAQTCSDIIAYINSKMSMDVKDLGTITRFNGMDIHQTRYYVKITCERYIRKMLQHHNWLTEEPTTNLPIPLPSDNEFAKRLDHAPVPENEAERAQLRQAMGFGYRQVIGELIWPMVKCRPDYAPHIIKLSQFSENPGKEHYLAARDLAKYLAATMEEGIYYWRETPVDSLPEGPLPQLHSDNHQLQLSPDDKAALRGYVDSDWGGDTVKRKSMTGLLIMYAGGVIAYKAKLQEIIAHSTTEAEFIAACDAAKVILFFRSILDDLDIPQDEATVLFEDNNGALMMANAQQPTRRTRHMDIKHFSLLDWVERDLLILQSITSSDNPADAMTKMLPKQLFYRHLDTYMGRRIPTFSAAHCITSCAPSA